MTPLESAKHHCKMCSDLNNNAGLTDNFFKVNLFWAYSSLSRYITIQNLRRTNLSYEEKIKLEKDCNHCKDNHREEKSIEKYLIIKS